MSVVENYQKAKCAQINLDDGNKILVSYGSSDMRVFKVSTFSLWPTEKNTIHIFYKDYLYKLNTKIGYDMSKDVVKILVDYLSQSKTVEEIKVICQEVENDSNFIDKI